jgi:hypothetical protein
MMHDIQGLPDNVVGVAAHGNVTGEDYETVLIPAVERSLETHEKLRVLYHLGSDFTGFLTAFEKIAVVTDLTWVSEAVKVFGFFIPCPVKVFGNDRLGDAKAWVSM